MKEEPLHPWIEPELEARIVALVLGEASDFEREELERLIEKKAELAMFRKRMTAVHGLLREVATGESAIDNDDWKLSDEKRNAVLAVIDGEENAKPSSTNASLLKTTSVKTTPVHPRRFNWKRPMIKAVALAAVITLSFSVFLKTTYLGKEALMAPEMLVMAQSYDESYDISAKKVIKKQKRINTANSAANRYTINEAEISSRGIDMPGSNSAVGLTDSIVSADLFPDGGTHLESVAFKNETSSAAEVGAAKFEADSRSSIASIQAGLGTYAEVTSEQEKGAELDKSLVVGYNTTYRFRKVGDKNALSFPDVYDKPAARRPTLAVSSAASSIAIPEFDDAGNADDSLLSLSAGFSGGFGMEMKSPASAADPFGSGSGAASDPFADAGDGLQMASADPFTTPGHVGTKQPAEPPSKKGNLARLEEKQANMPLGKTNTFNDAAPVALESQTPHDTSDKLLTGRRDEFAKTETKQDLDAFGEHAPKSSVAAVSPKRMRQKNFKPAQEEPNKAAAMADFEEEMPSKVVSKKKVMNKENRENYLRQVKSQAELTVAKNKVLTPQLKESKDIEQSGKGLLALNSPLPNSLEKIGKKIALKPDSLARSQTKQQLPAPPAGLNEKNAEDEAFSTFSLHVSDVSFKLAQAALAKGEWPDASKVRIEEFVNAFDYGDPMPNQNQKVASQMEQAIHPFLQQRNLLRVSMRTAAAGRAAQTPLRLTFLLDNSGSMERSDRRETVQRAFALLAQQLQPMDQVTLISFARQPRLIADKVSGAKADQLVQLVANIPSEGGTNLEAALKLAFEKAQEQQLDKAQNRIIMLTDGAANLGDANPERLSKMIENMRDAGIAFDAAGIGADGLNDEILEALTRKGDGRYYLLDQPEDADEGFARQIAGTLRPAAKNVKVQIEFNPKRVGKYKLLGFEKHRLKKEDFRNDKVDAAEMAAAEAGVAVYQFEAKPDGEGDVGSVSVRFRDLSTGQMIENRWPIPYQADAPRIEQAAPSLQIATSAALLAAKLKGGALAGSVDLQTLSKLISALPERQRNNKRVQELQQMLNVARQLSGN